MDFSKQLIRCSALGRIMTNGRAKSEMGETCKSFLKELYIEKVYGIKKEISSKYIEKGLMVEDSAIAFYSNANGGFYFKNDEWFNNEFISGTPDIISDELVIDIKSSWSPHSMPFKDEPIKKDYYYQLMGYMALTGLKTAKLAYVLIDTPIQLVEDEKRRLSWQMGMVSDLSPEYLEACAEIDKQHNFSHIPVEKRIVEFDINYDEKVVEEIYKRVQECRTYLNGLNG